LPGGLLRTANRVDNLLGMKGMSGLSLCESFLEHARDMGVVIEAAPVKSINVHEGSFHLESGKGNRDFSNLILATGSRPKRLDLPDAMYRIDGPGDLKGGSLLIIGGGDLAFDNALRVFGWGIDVCILHRSAPKANHSLVNEVREAGIRLVKGDVGMVSPGRDGYHLEGEGVFDNAAVFTGRVPDRSLIDHMGPVEVFMPSHETSVKGLYVIGDAASIESSQTAYAMSSGLSAAMDIARKVREDEGGP